MGGDPVPGPLDRIREQSDSSYYREMKARTKELDAPIRVTVIDSGSKKGWRSGRVVCKTELKPVFPIPIPIQDQ